jgi:hypothetical protein
MISKKVLNKEISDEKLKQQDSLIEGLKQSN